MPDYCTSVPALAQAPVIDGRVDCDLRMQSIVPMLTQPPDLAGIPARYAIAWRPDGIYVVIDVDRAVRQPAPTNQFPNCGDGIEIYIDDDGNYDHSPDYDALGTRQFIIAAPVDDVTTSHRGAVLRGDGVVTPWTAFERFGAFPRPGGFTVEALITGGDLGVPAWALAAGAFVGFNVSINTRPPTVMSPPVCEQDQYVMHGCNTDAGCQRPYLNVTSFCRPSLVR